MAEAYKDKIGYTDDGLVFIAREEGTGCLEPEKARELAEVLSQGGAGERWYAQELRNAAEQADKINERNKSPIWYPGKVE